MTLGATLLLALKTRRFVSLPEILHVRMELVQISTNTRKNARLRHRVENKSTLVSYLTSRQTLRAKYGASQMDSYKCSVRTALHLHTCGVMQRTSGTRSVKFRIQDKQHNRPGKEMPLESVRLLTIQVMQFSQPVNMIKLSMLILATVSIANYLAITVPTISTSLTGSAHVSI